MSVLLFLWALMGCVNGEFPWEPADDCNVICDSDGDHFRSTTCAQDFPQCGAEFIGTDCDDSQSGRHPNALEVCDEIDNNCDGVVDNGVDCDDEDEPNWGNGNGGVDTGDSSVETGMQDTEADSGDTGESCVHTEWYHDGDGDGYGAGEPYCAEDAPVGYVGDGTDCDDADEHVAPTRDYYRDADNDGFGDVTELVQDCDPPEDGNVYVERDITAPIVFDCNDADDDVFPGADEYCNEIDDNCDGTVDENTALDALTWYDDTDADGYGDVDAATISCSQPPGTVDNDEDCDDTNDAVNPDGIEVCDGVDNDCDSTVDKATAVDADTWYVDSDGDGHGDSATSIKACSQPTGYVHDGIEEDCDDGDSAISPSANELCSTNGVDDNCDGTSDEDTAADATTWEIDVDGDGFGSSAYTLTQCDQPTGYVDDDTDCDDGDADAYPGNTEVCDEIDNDCNGSVDEGVTITYYADSDSDGEGDSSSTADACSVPTGYVTNSLDCDDGDSTVNTSGIEVCDDGVDNDCNGVVDENTAVDVDTWYFDGDGDGYGDSGTSTKACTQPSNYVSDTIEEDCNDGDSAVNPGATEGVGDGVDQDCDGQEECYEDNDGDGFTDGSIELSTDTDCSDTGETDDVQYVAGYVDCDDVDADAYPGNTEVCDEIDNNCDGSIDEGVETTFYADADGDGEGDSSSTTDACDVPAGYVTNSDDCDDGDSAVNTSATEVCDDSVDNDCNGDTDGDDVNCTDTGS